jgi:hypothetical protein
MTRETGWFKSSFSSSGNDACVEVRLAADRSVYLRDTKNRDAGTLRFGLSAWTALTGMTALSQQSTPES